MQPDKFVFYRLPPCSPPYRGEPCHNVPQLIVQHSPAGFEWGYAGSGPADLALNILHLFLPPGCDGEEPIKLFMGECSTIAWDLHQAFKQRFIASMPVEGGVIYADEIRDWIVCNGQGTFAMM